MRLYLDLALNVYYIVYTVRTIEFKQMWYEICQADYCLKHFKLV